MDDKQIIKMYFERDEQAITATADKYSEFCRTIAFNILNSNEDCEEAINDTWLRVWNNIPPERPKSLPAYLVTIIRNISLDIYRKKYSKKRIGNVMSTTLDEISEMLPATINIEDQIEKKEVLTRINSFLETLPKKQRILFIRRYYYFDSIKDIAGKYNLSESYITVNLTRVRKKLANYLERERLI